MQRKTYGLGMLALLLIILFTSCAQQLGNEFAVTFAPMGQRQPYETEGVFCTSTLVVGRWQGHYETAPLMHPAGKRRTVNRYMKEVLGTPASLRRSHRYLNTDCFASWRQGFEELEPRVQENAKRQLGEHLSEEDYRLVVLSVQVHDVAAATIEWLETKEQ